MQTRRCRTHRGGDEYSDNLIEFLSDLGTNLSKQIPALDEKGMHRKHLFTAWDSQKLPQCTAAK
jgi:hypothetical protein